MKILCMLPAAPGVYPAEAEERRLRIIRSYSTPATEVHADTMPEPSGFNPWGTRDRPPTTREIEDRAAEQSVRRAIQAEREGYDAFCPFGTRDVGVREARQVVGIPVVGQTEACLLYCGVLDRRFAWVTYLPGSEERNRAWAWEAGVDHLMVASTAIGIPNSEFPERRAEVLERFIACAAEARAQGAELMGLVAMSICPIEFSAAELSAACGTPVLDALACQIGLAEWWHRTSLPPRLLRYPRRDA
jgi:Asp/Glu/hydantoin racemase